MDTLRQLAVLSAVRDATSPVTPERYFLVAVDDPEEAAAMHVLHADRAEHAMRYGEGGGVWPA